MNSESLVNFQNKISTESKNINVIIILKKFYSKFYYSFDATKKDLFL